MSPLRSFIIIAVFSVALVSYDQVFAQNNIRSSIDEQIYDAITKAKLGDTVSSISIFRNILLIDSSSKERCTIYLCISELQFAQNKKGNEYRKTLNEALNCGCNSEVILNKLGIYFDLLSADRLVQYLDSSIILYTKLITLNPNNGHYYAKRSNVKLSKGDTIGAEEDLQLAAKYGDKFAIWFLEDRERKKKIKK